MSIPEGGLGHGRLQTGRGDHHCRPSGCALVGGCHRSSFSDPVSNKPRVDCLWPRQSADSTGSGRDFEDPHYSSVQGACENDPTDKDRCLDPAQAIFLMEESVVQARSSAGSEPSRITLVRERLIVLRGAIFSLCVLALICTFGTIARVSTYLRERISKKHSLVRTMLKATVCVPPVLLIAFAWYWASKDVHHPDVTDPPIMELVLGEIAVLGLIMSIKGVRSRPYL